MMKKVKKRTNEFQLKKDIETLKKIRDLYGKVSIIKGIVYATLIAELNQKIDTIELNIN